MMLRQAVRLSGLATAAVALGVAALGAAPAQATIINVQFATSAETDGGGSPVHYAGTGALGEGGDYFNFDVASDKPTKSTLSNLKNSHGMPTDVAVTVTGGEFYNATDGTPAVSSPAALLGSYSDNYSAATPRPAGTFTISHLPANTPFKIYLYALNGHYSSKYTHTTTFTIGSASASSDGTIENSFSKGHNYVVLTGTTSAAGDISGTYSAPDGGEADFNGFQISY